MDQSQGIGYHADNTMRASVGEHYVLATVIIVVLVIVVMYLFYLLHGYQTGAKCSDKGKGKSSFCLLYTSPSPRD